MELPDVVGLPLGEAREVLEKAGVDVIRVMVTAPPRHRTSEYDDSFRVLKLTAGKDGKAVLLVCNPDIPMFQE